MKELVPLFASVLTLIISTRPDNYDKAPLEAKLPLKEMFEQILNRIEQPPPSDLGERMVQKQYISILLDQTPLANVKTNEIAVLKAKDAKEVALKHS